MNEDIRVAVLIEEEGRFLLGQEAAEIIRGLWNWQQGKVDPGEELETAAVREVKEETGLDISLVRKLTVLKNPFPGTSATHVWLGKIISGEINYSKEEILDLRWFTGEEIQEMKGELAGDWLLDIISSLK